MGKEAVLSLYSLCLWVYSQVLARVGTSLFTGYTCTRYTEESVFYTTGYGTTRRSWSPLSMLQVIPTLALCDYYRAEERPPREYARCSCKGIHDVRKSLFVRQEVFQITRAMRLTRAARSSNLNRWRWDFSRRWDCIRTIHIHTYPGAICTPSGKARVSFFRDTLRYSLIGRASPSFSTTIPRHYRDVVPVLASRPTIARRDQSDLIASSARRRNDTIFPRTTAAISIIFQ